jgi:DNA mismatch endonuclease (patch repair protein)
MDRLSKTRRSWNMGRIQSTNTGPERRIRSMLHRLGLRFRIHVDKLPGSPDIVLNKWRTVIFVNGCFWHRHRGCKLSYTPKSNIAFWRSKFERTLVRDQEQSASLRQLGWRVIVVWECELQNRDKIEKRLRRLFESRF